MKYYRTSSAAIRVHYLDEHHPGVTLCGIKLERHPAGLIFNIRPAKPACFQCTHARRKAEQSEESAA